MRSQRRRLALGERVQDVLGGRVAEAVVFGAVTTGAANDLQRVAEITHAMVHEYGMGTATASGARRATVQSFERPAIRRRVGDGADDARRSGAR